MTLVVRIHGQTRHVAAPPYRPLLWVLREFLLRETAALFAAAEGPRHPPFGVLVRRPTGPSKTRGRAGWGAAARCAP